MKKMTSEDRMKAMVPRNRQLLLTFIFLLVLVPVVILSWFAYRTVTQEEMVQRRRLEDSLFLEIDQANSRIQFHLDEAREDLFRSLSTLINEQDHEILADRPPLFLEQWADNENLVGRIYLLEEDRSIAYPLLDNTQESREADMFHWRYLNFFAGQ